MTAGSRHPRVLARPVAVAAALLITVLVLATLAPSAAARPDRTEPGAAQTASISLLSQTPIVPLGGAFSVQVGLGGVPPEGKLQLVLHDRVRSRSELAASMDGDSLRRQIYSAVTLLADLPAASDGSRRLSISFDPAAPGGISLTTAGVYPLEVVATDADGGTATSLVTHVVVAPAADDGSPPLAVGVVARLGAAPALQPDGSTELDPDDISAQLGLAQVLAGVPTARVTLAVVPETLDALSSVGSDDALALLDALQAAAVDRAVLARPYVDVSVEALAAVGYPEQLTREIERGRLLLADVLGVTPDDTTWLASPELGADGLAVLEQSGVRHAVVGPDQVEPLRSQLSLSLAQPFVLTPPGEDAEPSSIDALAIDAAIAERLEDDVSPAVLGHRILAELAALWFEQPGVDRAAVVPVDASVPPSAVQVLLEGLDAGSLFRPTGLTELFDDADPLLDTDDAPIDRALDPQRTASGFGPSDADRLRDGWSELDTLRGLLGADSPRTAAVADHLLLAAAADLDRGGRRAHLDAALAAVAEVTSGITATARTTITLTAREGTVPLVLRNDTGVPVDVVIHLRSSKLDFPDGESIPQTLEEDATRLDIAVEARASGAFPLEVEVRSPDGRTLLASTRYTVRSTAVAGAGLVLSIGAGLFLIVWWARHWRKTRRSARLVATTHPATGQGATPAQ